MHPERIVFLHIPEFLCGFRLFPVLLLEQRLDEILIDFLLRVLALREIPKVKILRPLSRKLP